MKFVKHDDPKNFEKAITPKTRALFIETIGNPVLDFTDVAEVAQDRPRARPSPHRRCHLHHPLPPEDHRARRGHRGQLAHQVDGRARHGHRRHRHRRRAASTGRTAKFKLFNEPDPNYHGLQVGARPARRPLRPSPSPCACAPFRCATSARASPPTTPGSSSRASSRSPCAWSATAPTRWPWPSG